MKLKDGVYGYHRRYGDGAFKDAPGCTYKPKKLDMRSPRLGVATATTQHTGLYATDEKTSTKFLVDTGACVSIISAFRTQQQFRDIKISTMLTAANETSMLCFYITTLCMLFQYI